MSTLPEVDEETGAKIAQALASLRAHALRRAERDAEKMRTAIGTEMTPDSYSMSAYVTSVRLNWTWEIVLGRAKDQAGTAQPGWEAIWTAALTMRDDARREAMDANSPFAQRTAMGAAYDACKLGARAEWMADMEALARTYRLPW